jgi:BirA family biotin operon repressor/biotin-[acetyl-CoA-carboxylase] ligase
VTFPTEWIVHHYVSLTSTMDRAALLARAGARDRTAVLSDEQTAGRGRGGRTWHSPAGGAIYCTLVLRPPVRPDRLGVFPLLMGVAVAETIEALTGEQVRLKWPNDVWLGHDPTHQKVAGILLTSSISQNSVEHVLVGIGINVCSPVAKLPPGATSLFAATGVNLSPSMVFRALLERVDEVYVDYLATDGSPSLASWRAHAALVHELVTIEDAGRSHSGTFLGVDDDGALLLRSPDGDVCRSIAGDLVRGPQIDQPE